MSHTDTPENAVNCGATTILPMVRHKTCANNAGQFQARAKREKDTPAVKSPLRYAGGKSRAIKLILPLLPATNVGIVSIFCGGSSVELARAGAGSVKCFDGDASLINFFKQVAANDNQMPSDEYRSVVDIANYYREQFLELPKDDRKAYYRSLKQVAQAANDKKSAAAYFAVNRASFSGAMSGGMSPRLPRFTASSIKYLKEFCEDVKALPISWHVGDFRQAIPQHPDDFLFLDPPYALEKGNDLYGFNGELHRDFDHEALASLLKNHDYWLLCYNDCERIRQLYAGYTILPVEWSYSMTRKPSSEILILSHRLAREKSISAANDNDPDDNPPDNPGGGKLPSLPVAQKSNAKLDQYYTQPTVSGECIDIVRSLYPDVRNFIEPAAGAGAFMNPLTEAGYRVVGFDIDPKRHDIHQADFLKLSAEKVLCMAAMLKSETVVVGNPPFGKRGNLAAQFINKCLLVGLAVGFILPRTARRYSFQQGLCPDACLIHDSDLSSDAFVLDGKPVKVGCCFQIWTPNPGNRPDLRIRTKPRRTHPDFLLQQYNAQGKNRNQVLSGLLNAGWDLAVKRQGFGTYELIESNRVPIDLRKHWLFIRVNAPIALKWLGRIDFGKLARRKAVRAPGLSCDDIVAEYEAIVAMEGQALNDNSLPLSFSFAG